MDLISGRVAARSLAMLGLGVVVGVVGTAVHRATPPWGLVLALAAVASCGVVARAWVGWVGMLTLALGVFTVVSVLAGPGPGGDALIVAEPLSLVWFAGALAVALAALLPGRWFRDAVPVQAPH